MHAEFRNVNDAFHSVVSGIASGEIATTKGPSRVGDVLTIPEPVILSFHRPQERVLFNIYRDANPFFHLYEAMWMLAGRNDVEPLAYYNSQIADIASDDGQTFNGAYGYRWREYSPRNDYDEEAYGTIDQLSIIIDHLRDYPNSRRVVLQMWNVEDDLLKIGRYEKCPSCEDGKWQNGPGKAMLEEGADCPICKGKARIQVGYSKDVCCNTNIYFSIRDGLRAENPSSNIKYKFLDMTVCNRSNDIVWGMLGANYVHFSFLQEYIANSLGVEVGLYHQFSNNAHVYTERFKPDLWLKEPITMFDPPNDDHLIYSRTDLTNIPLVVNRERFDEEVRKFVALNRDGRDVDGYMDYAEPFLSKVAQPMMHAFHMHKARDYTAAKRWLNYVASVDWAIAGSNWIKKRQENYESKNKMIS